MKVSRALSGVTKLGLDTAPIIYLIDDLPEYQRTLQNLFSTVNKNRIKLVTSSVSLAEVLVYPKRNNDAAAEALFKRYLLNNEAVQVVSIDVEIAEQSAELRARYNLRLADALQIAACLTAGCEAFLTNDDARHRVGELPILILKELTT